MCSLPLADPVADFAACHPVAVPVVVVFRRDRHSVESGCVTLQSLVLSIRIMCKDLWKLLHDIYTSVLTEWNYESISYKPYLTRREMRRITHHVSDVSVVTCITCNGHVYTSNV
jgi:hypothetical protein